MVPLEEEFGFHGAGVVALDSKYICYLCQTVTSFYNIAR